MRLCVCVRICACKTVCVFLVGQALQRQTEKRLLKVTRVHEITKVAQVGVMKDNRDNTKSGMEVCVCVRANANINLARNIKCQSSEKNGEARQQ